MKQVSGKGSNRTEIVTRVVLHDLMDDLFLKCSIVRDKVMKHLETLDLTEEQVIHYLDTEDTSIKQGDVIAEMTSTTYSVTLPEMYVKSLIRLNRKKSTWEQTTQKDRANIKVPALITALNRIVQLSVVSIYEGDSTTYTIQSIIQKAEVNVVTGLVTFTLDRHGVDLLSPNNLYRCKYLADSFVLGSEYCKNLHSFISYYGDVFTRGSWSNSRPYNYTAIATLADAMGVRFSDEIREYDAKTSTYSRSGIVQMLKTYVAEINEKTRINSIFGKLCFEIERSKADSRGKVIGFRFYFEKEA